ALADPNPFVRESAVDALGRLGDPRALAALRKAENDPDPDVRRSALRAREKLRRGEDAPQ
ncbi:MAG TPA: HEAT repeat domain-containing protein, partial [Phycisphaerae bacterium]|nr:HEAT repeat domain-containing protein [Phycisphaerae bacterium]